MSRGEDMQPPEEPRPPERLDPEAERAEDADTARLVERFQSGESEAFATLYTRYFTRVYNYLRVVLGHHEDSEDAAQQVFAKALAALGDFEQRGEPFRGWLFTIAHNVAANELRRRHKLEPMPPEEIDRLRDEPVEPVEDEFSSLGWIKDPELLMFVERLPAPQRQVLVLRYLLDLPHAQIGSILGRTENDVAALHSRALAFVRKRLAAIGRGPDGPASGDRAGMRRALNQAPVLRSRRFSL